MGVAAVDIDRPELRLDGEVKARDAADVLNNYRQQRDAELAAIRTSSERSSMSPQSRRPTLRRPSVNRKNRTGG